MALNASDVRIAASNISISPTRVCEAAKTIIPVLRELKKGKSFWLAWGMTALIGALEDYVDSHCGSQTIPGQFQG